jgi:hypothetical protein
MFTLSFGLKVPYLAGSLIMVATSLGASIPSAPGSAGVFHVLTVLALSVWSVPTEEADAVGGLNARRDDHATRRYRRALRLARGNSTAVLAGDRHAAIEHRPV